MATQIGNPKSGCPNKDPEEKEEKQDTEKHWIEYEIQDEKGKPVPNVTIRVILPDESVVEKTSDENGLIVINNIESGNCRIEYNWTNLNISGAAIEK